MSPAPSPKPTIRGSDASAQSRPARRHPKVGADDPDPLYLQKLFAANVRLVRLARGISQEELADRASLDRTYISSIERRLRNLSIQNIQRLALALEIEPRQLLNPDLGGDARYSGSVASTRAKPSSVRR